MFRGSSFHTIDSKGRIIVPARFRDVIKSQGSNGVMVSRMDGGLVAYTYDEWRKIETRILSLAEKSENMRRFRRVFIGGAFVLFAKFLILLWILDFFDLQNETIYPLSDLRLNLLGD